MNLSSTWQHHYHNLALNKDANKNLQVLAKGSTLHFNNELPIEIIKAFNQDKDSIIHAKSPDSNKLLMYYNITNLGGFRACPNNKVISLVRKVVDATPVSFNVESSTRVLEVYCTANATLNNITVSTGVETVAAPPTRLRN